MTITVGSSTPMGTYPITVTGNGGGNQQNTTVTLTVTGGAQLHHFGLARFAQCRAGLSGNLHDYDHHHRWIQQLDQSLGFGYANGHGGEFQSGDDSGTGCGQLDDDHYGGAMHTGGNLSHHGYR